MFTTSEWQMIHVALDRMGTEAFDRGAKMREVPVSERGSVWREFYTKELEEYEKWRDLRKAVMNEWKKALNVRENPYV